jgi:hypothetical protein
MKRSLSHFGRYMTALGWEEGRLNVGCQGLGCKMEPVFGSAEASRWPALPITGILAFLVMNIVA